MRLWSMVCIFILQQLFPLIFEGYHTFHQITTIANHFWPDLYKTGRFWPYTLEFTQSSSHPQLPSAFSTNNGWFRQFPTIRHQFWPTLPVFIHRWPLALVSGFITCLHMFSTTVNHFDTSLHVPNVFFYPYHPFSLIFTHFYSFLTVFDQFQLLLQQYFI